MTLQLKVFRDVLDDLPYLAEILPCILFIPEKITPSPVDKECEKLKGVINYELQRILVCLHHARTGSDKSTVTLEQAKTLRRAIVDFSSKHDSGGKVPNQSEKGMLNTVEEEVEEVEEVEVGAVEPFGAVEAQCESITECRIDLREKKAQSNRKNRKKRKAKSSGQKKSVEMAVQKPAEKITIGLKEQSEVLQPPEQWEKDLDEARKRSMQGLYAEAIEQYDQVLNAVDDPVIIATALVEKADISLKSVNKEINQILKLLKFVHYSHSWFQSLVDGHHPKGKPVLRGELLTNTNKLIKLLRVTDPRIEDILALLIEVLEVLEELERLKGNKNNDVSVNKLLLENSNEELKEFQRKKLEGLDKLLKVYSLRSQWLKSLPQNEQKDKEHPELQIPKLIDNILQSQETGRKHYADSSDLNVKISQKKWRTWRSASTIQFPTDDYRRFRVDGDGHCFYRALAIALNQLNNTGRHSVESVRRSIHRRLEKLINFIREQRDNDQLVKELEALLGSSFANLVRAVLQRTILSAAPPSVTSAEILQHYGELNYALVLLLDEPLSLGVQLQNGGSVFSYNYNVWLNLAPSLLAALIREGEVSLQHWPEGEALEHHLLSESIVPHDLQQRIEQLHLTAILVHSGTTGSLSQHFDVQVLYPTFIGETVNAHLGESELKFTMLFFLIKMVASKRSH